MILKIKTEPVYARKVKFKEDEGINTDHSLSLSLIQYIQLGISFTAIQPETPLENADKRQLCCSLAYL